MSTHEEEQRIVETLRQGMLVKLRKMSGKPHWNAEYNLTLFTGLLDEVRELHEVLVNISHVNHPAAWSRESREDAIKECEDVANFAAMIAHRGVAY